MNWTLCFVLSLATLIAAFITAIVLGAGKYRQGRILTPFNVVLGGVFISVFISLLPIYKEIVADASGSILKTVLFSLHNTFQVFTIDADRSIILENINCYQNWLSAAYSSYLTIAFVVSPILTFGFLISFFKNVSAYIRYLLHFFGDVYVFSELNEKSFSLGADIKKNHKNAVIVFTDVFGNDDEISCELIERARGIKAVCFKKDIMSINFKLHFSRSKLMFFTIDRDEKENIRQSLKLIRTYCDRDNTSLYVFSSDTESELLLSTAEKGFIKVRRINEVRSLVNRILYKDGVKLFESAVSAGDGCKNISAVIIGVGKHGTEMLKALSWYCQMDGYKINIDAFDIDEFAEDRFSATAPELMSDRYNGVSIPGEAEYTIRIHSGYDVTTKTFADEISKLKTATYVFISLGSDEANIKAAVEMRMIFERMNIHPVIESIVYSSESVEALKGVTNYSGQKYDIDFIGDIKSMYSEAVIINSELEEDALKRHMKWGEEEEFWRYEYNYLSSVASAIHMRARIACGIPGASKAEGELTDAERDMIEKTEHRRWNAYMRSEGYVYSGSHDKKSRNDLGKMHHDLVDYDSLEEGEKRKDSVVGTK